MTETTQDGLETRLRTLWVVSEKVGKLRDTNKPREFTMALICRNDAILSLRLLYSAQHQKIKKLETALQEAING